jgi:carboxylesterase
MTAPILPGAEPFSSAGGPHGALVLHGFTGSPQSMRGLAEAFADAGFAVELPLLPGHGTSVEDMAQTTWADWSQAAQTAHDELASRVDEVVVAGLSMGGTLALWLAAREPDIAGLVVINAAVDPLDQSLLDLVHAMQEEGETTMPGIGSDIADPDQTELAYPDVPLSCLMSLNDAWSELDGALARITIPTLVLTSPQDHVVAPTNSDTLVNSLGGVVERVSLDHSYHVATLDYDRDLINERAVEFARKVTS